MLGPDPTAADSQNPSEYTLGNIRRNSPPPSLSDQNINQQQLGARSAKKRSNAALEAFNQQQHPTSCFPQPIMIKRRGRSSHANEDDDAVAALLLNNNPFLESPRSRVQSPTVMNSKPSTSVSSSSLNQHSHPAPIHATPGRVGVAPSMGAIALLTPSRPLTPRLDAGVNTPKPDKGLRHFSARVSAKVEQKGCTTYNEVADELVQEIGRELGVVEKYDHKNIRRRVYDALNVLMAIDIIKKDKKEIRWLGLPSDASQDVKMLETERMAVERRVAEKRRVVGELVQRHVALKALIARNQRNEAQMMGGVRAARLIMPEAGANSAANDRLFLPFILVNAPKDCRVHCEMLEDRTQYFFDFDAPFLINEDIELLKLMGLDTVSIDEASQWLPSDLIPYIPHSRPAMHSKSKSVTGIGNIGILSSGIQQQQQQHYYHHRRTGLSMISEGARPPPHVLPYGKDIRAPMSDGLQYTHTSTTAPSANNLSRRFRETLSSFADFGSSPVI